MKIQLVKAASLAVVAWATTLVVAHVQSADAATRRVSALSCRNEEDAVSREYFTEGQIWVNTPGDVVYVSCAVPTDSTLSHAATVQLNVHGYEPAGISNWSKACVRAYDVLDLACGTAKNWGTGYGGASTIDVSEWQAEPGWFPYLLNKLSKSASLSEDSSIVGYYMRD